MPEDISKPSADVLATIEEPSRAIVQLMNLAKGHALSQSRSFITKEDVTVVIKVVLSTRQ